jgi:murein DD-endopeptidase MepM/ murein hydrolase activator NlpD
MPVTRHPFEVARLVPLLAIAAIACARGRTVSPPAPAPSAVPVTEMLAAKSLIVPVQGVDPSRIRDTYAAARGGRTHDAVDILAPRGTPVVAADHGRVVRLSTNAAGGVTIYQIDRDERFVYYYAHLDRYHEGLKEGMTLRQGEVIGYVGTSGNAPPGTPHLHFQVMIYRGDGRYWAGEPVNPHPYFTRSEHRP